MLNNYAAEGNLNIASKRRFIFSQTVWIMLFLAPLCAAGSILQEMLSEMDVVSFDWDDTSSTLNNVDFLALKSLFSATGGQYWTWTDLQADDETETDDGSAGIAWDFMQSDSDPCADLWKGKHPPTLVPATN